MLGAVSMFTSCSLFGNDSEEADKVKVIDVKLTDEEYAFVCKKGNTELVNSFNEFLATIKDNGTFNTLVDKNHRRRQRARHGRGIYTKGTYHRYAGAKPKPHRSTGRGNLP